jgi:Flp pilus assembly protein TadD
LEFAPEFPWLQQSVGLSLLELGQNEPAIQHLRRGAEIAGQASFANSYLAYGLGRAGHKDECQAVIEEWLELNTRRYVPPTDLAIMYMGLGDYEQALGWLEKGYQQRDVWMVFIGVLPFWDPLRDDARFADLLRRVGLPSRSDRSGRSD